MSAPCGMLVGMSSPMFERASPPPGPTTVRLRPLRDDDVEGVLALNELDVALLAPMDRGRLEWIHGLADRFDVIEVDGAFGGFVVTVAPGAAYDSENYRWFSRRYDSFSYLDRIVLARSVRRGGVGSRVYDELEADATPSGRMLLEVNAVPPNLPSLQFHRRRGYDEVGRLGHADHEVALMAKELTPDL